MRAVIDTNVLISATFWTGKPKQILNQVRRREITFLTSQVLLNEFKEVLIRKDKPFKLSVAEAERIMIAMRDLAEIVQPHSRVTVCRDEDDNRVLELKSFERIKIVTVENFLR